MNVVDTFVEDCTSRIESERAKLYMKNIKTDTSNSLPPATFFLMGLSFGVIAARVACTCGLFKN